MLNYKIDGLYDLALCMGNSLNFFNAKDAQQILNNVSAHLKPGGHLLINSWSIAEISFKNFEPNGWSRINDIKFLNECQLLFNPTRIETESIMIAPNGDTETKHAVDYIYSLNELETMLNAAGLQMKEVFSIPGRKKFTLGEPRAYIVAEKTESPEDRKSERH